MSDYNDQIAEHRLATTTKSGGRAYVHPQDVNGRWTDIRKRMYWLLVIFYLVFPWIHVDGRQLVLLNLPAREFYFFGSTFYGQDGPILIYILLGFVFFFSFVTSLWGRVWCGYACPQTVFIDIIYRQIEKLVEGSARKRDTLEASGWTWTKIWKRSLKWFLYLMVSLHIVHSGLGYFVGTRELLEISMHSPTENMTLFLTMVVMTGIILFDFGWFREQFCIIACPYGRFQSIVMDENSLIVAYDKRRGEPRKRTIGINKEDEGDCVNCNRCVHVCPTGIDIRDGLQMECIACTMCIDACDDIMRKVKKPEGLIKYTTELEQDGEPKKISPRVYIYVTLFLVCVVGLFSHLNLRKDLKTQFLRGSKSPFQLIEKGNSEKLIVNHYKLKLRYFGDQKLNLELKVRESNELGEMAIIIPELPIEIENENLEVNVFFQFPMKYLTNGQRILHIDFIDKISKKVIKQAEVNLVGPIR
ncbi:MAG: cytochrome c oxidase accessory protein CcoG [Halobacteriovoraceae bacterium]|jgi:cytochrome c oxidase accessory protein FixG|nr:cytochrome c oxidase accessory protein CcoG [Halobacteriovoraceae bacterium]